MKLFILPVATLIILVLTSPLCASASDLSTGEKDTIFIGAPKVQPSVIEMADKKKKQSELKLAVDSLESQLISALNATRVFQLVDLSPKDDMEQEENIAAVPADPNVNIAAQSAKKIGAKFALMLQIDGFEDKSETAEYKAIGRASLNRTIFLSAVVQIVDTATGKLIPDSPSLQLTKTEVVENARIGQLSGSDAVIVSLAKEMAKKLSQEAVALLRPAKVLSVTGKQILFNRGSDAGFAKGDLVQVYSVQNVKDDDAGEMFRNEVAVGQAIIDRIDKNQSYATIIGEGLGIVKGCVVRFEKTAASRATEIESPSAATLPDFGTKNDTGMTPGSSEKPLKWK